MRDRSGQRTTAVGSATYGSEPPEGGGAGGPGGGGGGGGHGRSSGGSGNSRRSAVNPMASVAIITGAALVGVGVLAWQASGSPQKTSAGSSTVHASPSVSLSPSGNTSVPVTVDPNALPANSGSGLRIVYGLAAKRVWLVGADNKVQRVAQAVPGTVNPTPKTSYKVTSRTNSRKGQDGTQVQYVVIFGDASDGTSLGFDAVAGAAGLPPAPTGKTGGVRMSQEDALELWKFTSSGNTPVVVVP